jgi:hypothetical protein
VGSGISWPAWTANVPKPYFLLFMLLLFLFFLYSS